MSPKFQSLIDQIQPLFERLQEMKPVQKKDFPLSSVKRGVYLFTDPKDGHLYVGRSNHIRRRWGLHCNLGSTHNQASFAFKLAREATGNTEASYQPGSNSREGLLKDSNFKSEFEAAKTRIQKMEFRYVEVDNPNEKFLLEFYAAIALETRYNDFDNH